MTKPTPIEYLLARGWRPYDYEDCSDIEIENAIYMACHGVKIKPPYAPDVLAKAAVAAVRDVRAQREENQPKPGLGA